MGRATLALLAIFAATANLPAQNLSAVQAAGRKILPLQKKLGPPAPGDWLEKHPEPGQTFGEYMAWSPNRPTKLRTTLYLQPLGTFEKIEQALLDDTMEVMGHFFGIPVKQLDSIPLNVIPTAMRRETFRGDQIMSGYVLAEVLKPRRPKDAVAMLALTKADLWAGEGWNFVFGQATLDERVGVWSFARFGDPAEDYAKTLRRTLATAIHETGHMLGIPHCSFYECGMNGSNSLEESDRRPIPFCVMCEQKIWWGCKVDPVKRYEALVDFATRRNLERESGEWKALLNAVKVKP